MMNESAFETFVTEYLEDLSGRVEEKYLDDVEDLDFHDGILTIELDDGRVFLINRHLPNQEVWLSSPISSGSHYKFDEKLGKWLCIRTQNELESLLFQELESVI